MISVISPFHRPIMRFMSEAWRCLKAQSFKNWEWILVPNGGAFVPDVMRKEKNVKVVEVKDDKDAPHNRIGRLKRAACDAARGEIIVELDLDDILMPEALMKISQAFGDHKVNFVYSNDAEFQEGSWESNMFSPYWGWRHRPFIYKKHKLVQHVAWPPSVHMMRFVFWAPDHVRAWRKAAYDFIGGHDPSLSIGDDHDLCCRFYVAYGAAGFKHIDDCLYLYRVHGENTCRVWNEEIQKQTDANYCRYSRDMIQKWARDEDLEMIDLGAGENTWPGYKSVDIKPPADMVCDLNKRWPFEDSSVGAIKAHHIFEHLRDPIHTMNEAYRVLAPGGWLLMELPSTEGRGAFQDPTHVSFWNENSFLYYTHRQWAKFIKPAMNCRFQKSRIVTYFPSKEWEDLKIPVVQADLIALKPPYDQGPPGEVLI